MCVLVAVACYQPWRHIIPTAYIVSTGVVLLLLTAVFLLPSRRWVSLSPGRSMIALVLGGGFFRRLQENRMAKWERQRDPSGHRVRTGKLTRSPAQVPGEATRPAHLVALETTRNKAET